MFPSTGSPMEFREKTERKSKKVNSTNASQRTLPRAMGSWILNTLDMGSVPFKKGFFLDYGR